jgi:cell division septal protein FtsQ
MSRPEPVRRRNTRQTLASRTALLLAACVLAAGALGAGLWHEARNPRFAVEIVAIDGLVHSTPAQVIAAAALAPAQNAWLINRGALTRRIEALPWVGRATLSFGWPNRLTIKVTEREAAARVAISPAGGEEEPVLRYALIDDGQRVLEITSDPRVQADLPVLVVTPAPSEDPMPGSELGSSEVALALDADRRLTALGLRVSQVAIAPSTGISATADRNLRVLFGEDEDLAKKAQLFQAIVAKISTPSRIAYVDVRSVRAPTVLYR